MVTLFKANKRSFTIDILSKVSGTMQDVLNDYADIIAIQTN
jgi:hypothetical protein